MMKLAISTCPNDTFAFHALLNRKVDWQGIDFTIDLLDIQELNAGLMAGRFDLAKASFHAAIILADSTMVLPSGSALGYGVGPLLLAAQPNSTPDNPSDACCSVLCPGELTTATLLYRMFYADSIAAGKTQLVQTIFSEIMPMLTRKEAGFGVCIHEGRFTWEQQGLYCVQDLGTRWEQATQMPLPLGGILARRNLSYAQIAKAQAVIRESIEYGLAHREETLPTMRRYAQEFDDDVLMQHVALYVNQWTIDLGEIGRQSLTSLSEMAIESGIVPANQTKLEVFS